MPEIPTNSAIPATLTPYFQEYDLPALDIVQDANLIIQRSLEFGDWEEMRWLFRTYGTQRLRTFLRRYGERMLSPVAFNYWRKLLRLRKWEQSPFPIKTRELWNP